MSYEFNFESTISEQCQACPAVYKELGIQILYIVLLL